MLLTGFSDWLNYLLLGSFLFLIILVPLLAWLAYSGLLTRANYVDDQPDSRIMLLSATGELPPTALSTHDLRKMDVGLQPDHASALRVHQLSDENPEAATVRELKRRTRVLTLLHRVTEKSDLPVEPVIESRSQNARSVSATVNESRRRRLEELLRRIGDA